MPHFSFKDNLIYSFRKEEVHIWCKSKFFMCVANRSNSANDIPVRMSECCNDTEPENQTSAVKGNKDVCRGMPVTVRIKYIRDIPELRQPPHGYLSIDQFVREDIDKIDTLYDMEKESCKPFIVGLAVDYLTRFSVSGDRLSAFQVSIEGASILSMFDECINLLFKIKNIDDDDSIKLACQLCCFDGAARTNRVYTVRELNTNNETVHNIRIMVKRALKYFEKEEMEFGLTFPGGYTKKVNNGDCDFVTKDTLWDFKVSKYPPTIDNSLQLLMYWRMGIHSTYKEKFQKIKYLGIFNPRLGVVYKAPVDDISESVINKVDFDIIGYPREQE